MRHLDRLKVAAGELRRDRLADGDHERPSLRLQGTAEHMCMFMSARRAECAHARALALPCAGAGRRSRGDLAVMVISVDAYLG